MQKRKPHSRRPHPSHALFVLLIIAAIVVALYAVATGRLLLAVACGAAAILLAGPIMASAAKTRG